MNTILVLVGLPGSGKTTFAKKLINDYPTFIRVNRDDLRIMLRNSAIVGEELESVITATQDLIIDKALSKNKDIVLDNTHCKAAYIKDIVNKFGNKANIKIKIVGAELSFEDIKKQNLNRETAVPVSVIDKMTPGYKYIVKHKEELLQYIAEKVSTPEAKTLKQDPTLPKAIIVDIDGTVAHMDDLRGPFDWSKVLLDNPDKNVLSIIRVLSKKYKIIFVSGRDESCRELTEEWIDIHFNEPSLLYMRPAGDYRKDTIIKTELYNTHIKDKYYVDMVFDDRKCVVDNWRSLGLKCAQVQEGNF